MVSGFTFKSLIYFVFILVYSVKAIWFHFSTCMSPTSPTVVE